MSYLMAMPGTLQAAAASLANIGSSVGEASTAAAAATTALTAAANDEVSVAIAAVFSGHGKAFQALSAQAAQFHAQIAQTLSAGAGAYASAEAFSVGALQTLTQTLPVPDLAVSIGGFTLLQSGSATANSDPFSWGIAIASGANSTAKVSGNADAIAFGANSFARASANNLATATGDNSVAIADTGIFNQASALGPNSAAYAQTGNLQTANALGPYTTAYAINGDVDIAQSMGTGSTAIAGGGISDNAIAAGAGTIAIAGASFPNTGNLNSAVVFGNMLSATMIGGPGVNIVTPLFNVYWLPFNGLNL